MSYKPDIRRHLCDMHIEDWDDKFLSEFSAYDYIKNLKTAKIQNVMLYFQSHAGLCYYPTKSGKIHNAFIGKEDTMRLIIDLCRKEKISVTGYYSLIYNLWAYNKYPEWRMVNKDGIPFKEIETPFTMDFAAQSKSKRYGHCCPNNPEYRKFTVNQIKEIADYSNVDSMFYDMLLWPGMCYCEHCKTRWAKEVGGEIPTTEVWSDERWLLHMRKRREWMGEFAAFITETTKKHFSNVSVSHNVACSALPNGMRANAEEVIDACDYVGGDLYRGMYTQAFTCMFYRSIPKNQIFEYMISRATPNLSAHTNIKSEAVLESEVFITAAYHGASRIIDAIDPIGTLDARVYRRIGDVFEKLIPYEDYLKGKMVEDVGIYYSLKSKINPLNPRCDKYTNYLGTTNTVGTMICENLLCGITGGFNDISKYKLIIASCLTKEDNYDNDRLIKYVSDGGVLYLSGADNEALLNEFFNASVEGRTDESVVYISPKEKYQYLFDYFNSEYPLQFDGSAPIVKNLNADEILATVTLPYTNQITEKFASIHSDPPGISTEIPAVAVTKYGKGSVIWSTLPIECIELYDYRHIFINLLKYVSNFTPTISSNAPDDVIITAFETDDSILINTVLINDKHKARKVEPFFISYRCNKLPEGVSVIPSKDAIPFAFDGEKIYFESHNMKIFNMYEIKFKEE